MALVEIPAGQGEEPRLKLTQDIIDWMLDRPQPPLFNAYTCRRRPQHGIITIDIHSGVTPMFLACKHPHCDADMVSNGYPNNGAGPVPEFLWDRPAWEWFRPSEPEWRKCSTALKDHILRGGLDMRDTGLTFRQWYEREADRNANK